MGEFKMPTLGADMEAGTIAEWRVQPGDTVHRGDIVAVVETEKSDIEVEVFEDGVVEALLVEPGQPVPVGTPLAHITSSTATPPSDEPAAEPEPEPVPEPVAAPEPEATSPAEPERPAEPAPDAPRTFSPLVRRLAETEHVELATLPGTGAGGLVTRADVEQAGSHGRVPASPLARRRAREQGIALEGLVGHGPEGAIVAADLPSAPPASPAPPTPAAGVPAGDRPEPAKPPASRGRNALANLMSRSKREIPHYYLATTIDLDRAVQWLAEANEARDVTERILPAALLLRATVVAAGKHHALNGHWLDGEFRPSAAIHLGVAINLRGGGLVAPAIRDAQDLSLEELMGRLRDLVDRARAGRIRSSEMTDPTITVTNLGDQGVESVYGVIYPPQVAMVGFGSVVERPWADQHMLTVRPVVTATLAADHRVTDGHTGARFLKTIDRLLQDPEKL